MYSISKKGKAFHVFILLPFFILLPSFSAASKIDWEASGREAVDLLVEYIKVKTVNPPGDEDKASRFFARILEKEGIGYQIFPSAPGRSNIYARLKGDGTKRAIILLHHMDVVDADKRYWSVAPFEGIIKDGYIYGRGTLDTKGLGIAELMAFLSLKRAGINLKRDVIFLATADEEAGGKLGAGWIVKNKRELVADADYLINEGGTGVSAEKKSLFGIEVAQKSPLWLRLTFKGPSGHGSRPIKDSSTNRLIKALSKLIQYQPPVRIIPEVAEYFRNIAPLQKAENREKFKDIANAIKDPYFLSFLEKDLYYNSIIRNTISPTVLQGSPKVNIIPTETKAEIDCRLLPGQNPDTFIQELREIMGDESVRIEKIMSFPSPSSLKDTELFKAIEVMVTKYHPGSVVTPYVPSGFSDAHYFRNIGVVCYGFSPFLIPREDEERIHGNDERISVKNVKRGTRILYELLLRICQ